MSKLSDLLLGATKKHRFTFSRKRKDGAELPISVLISVLTQDELDRAMADAVVRVDELLKGKPNAESTRAELLEQSRVIEVLSRALRDPDAEEEPWASPEDLRTRLSDVEVGLLYKAFCDFQDEQGPIVASMTEADFNALSREIAEEASLVPLALLAPDLRRSFVISLASRHVTSSTASSSHSSNSDASGTENAKSMPDAAADT